MLSLYESSLNRIGITKAVFVGVFAVSFTKTRQQTQTASMDVVR
jgi:hypothetical protein